ncbi:MAG TPA: cytochrome c [Gaiellaceae bacterium]
MPGRRRPKPIVAAGEVLVWLLFALLLAPAGAVGWAIGHYTGHQGGTRTVTVGAASTATTVAAPTTTTTTPAATTTAAAAPSANGKAIFISSGCGACHTFKPAGTSATVGPDLDTAPEKDAPKAKMPLAAFVKQSIVDPNAYISPGFPKGVMPPTFGATLSKAKIDALVAYIVTKK